VCLIGETLSALEVGVGGGLLRWLYNNGWLESDIQQHSDLALETAIRDSESVMSKGRVSLRK
jgi:hypothetical protein